MLEKNLQRFIFDSQLSQQPRKLTHTPRKTGGRGWTLDNVGKSEKTRKSHVFCSPLKNRVFKGKIGGFA